MNPRIFTETHRIYDRGAEEGFELQILTLVVVIRPLQRGAVGNFKRKIGNCKQKHNEERKEKCAREKNFKDA